MGFHWHLLSLHKCLLVGGGISSTSAPPLKFEEDLISWNSLQSPSGVLVIDSNNSISSYSVVDSMRIQQLPLGGGVGGVTLSPQSSSPPLHQCLLRRKCPLQLALNLWWVPMSWVSILTNSASHPTRVLHSIPFLCLPPGNWSSGYHDSSTSPIVHNRDGPDVTQCRSGSMTNEEDALTWS